MTDDLPQPISARPFEGHRWDAGTAPWLRSLQDATVGEPGVGYSTCMFCGALSLKLSVGDNGADPGRLTLYCDNSYCDAREMELLVTRDGASALRRADVRALRRLDAGGALVDESADVGPKLVPVEWGHGVDDEAEAASVYERRTSSARSVLSF